MKYVVAEGNSFTANRHIYSQGEEIPEAVFGDKEYFAKLISDKKILQVAEEHSKESPVALEESFSEKVAYTDESSIKSEAPVKKSKKKSKGE